MTKYLYQGSREIRTFVELNHGVNVLIEKTEKEEKGNYYTTMAALLLNAFTFEAYLNHLGNDTFKFWSEVETISIMNKYTVLCKQFSLSPDFSHRPYQTIKKLFTFRNAIAHGKSQILEETKEVNSQNESLNHSPKTHREEYCTLNNAKQAKEDVSTVIKELHRAAGLGDYPFTHGLSCGIFTDTESRPNT